MRVLVTGASGHIGSAVVPELQSHGHSVVALARSGSAADALSDLGVEVVQGDLDDPAGLGAIAAQADGVIHLAFRHDLMREGDLETPSAIDLRAIEAMGEALAGSGKPLVTTNGTPALTFAGIVDRDATERDVLNGVPRADSENATIALADRGVRSSLVRLAPAVHSDLDRHGFVPGLIQIARERGVSGYVGDGANRWPAVNTRDAAVLFRLALESARPGTRLHAVAEVLPVREVAEAIARRLGLPTESVAAEQTAEHFGFLAFAVGLDNPVSSALTREWLSWAPTHPTVIADIEQGHYFDER